MDESELDYDLVSYSWPYSKRFDAAFDLMRDEWLEEACTDPHCRFCSTRPSRPSEAMPELFKSVQEYYVG